MGPITRVSLPGYNALTDTNLDHFSLYSGVDNVLIKRLLTESDLINDGSPTIKTIAHNLGYIPFFLVHYYDEVNNVWSILNNQYNTFSVPSQLAAIDTSSLYIYNYGGHASGKLKTTSDIFYDNMNDNTAPLITESSSVFKVTRPGKDAKNSRNPNDYIMHSDLNNFKILATGKGSGDIASTSSISFSHGANVQEPYKYMVFLKFKDGKTILMGGNSAIKSYSEETTFFTTSMDGSKIYITYHLQGSTSNPISVSWYIFGTGKDKTILNGNPTLAVAKSGFNVLTETNPDNFNFHSRYNTLKYYLSDTYSMTVSTTTVQVIPHNLGYVPFFIVFVGDLENLISGGYALAPYYLARSSLSTPNNDIAVWAYADENNLYLKAYFQSNAVGTSKIFNFYYKLFKNNLGL